MGTYEDYIAPAIIYTKYATLIWCMIMTTIKFVTFRKTGCMAEFNTVFLTASLLVPISIFAILFMWDEINSFVISKGVGATKTEPKAAPGAE